jgi:hypothetical protein
MSRKTPPDILTYAQWRRIPEERKCVENGQHYVLRTREGQAEIAQVIVTSPGFGRTATPVAKPEQTNTDEH